MTSVQIGVVARLSEQPADELSKVVEVGLANCQVISWRSDLWTDDVAALLASAAQKLNVEITTFWAGYDGPAVWNLIDGPATIGLVPASYRPQRLGTLKKAARFAASLGIPSITTHVGFLPEDPNSEDFVGTVAAIKELVSFCGELGIEFWFETGQETPVTLLRAIERIDLPNVGVNFDPANLIMYGKANPLDALDVIGRYVRGVHAKDALYPASGDKLGQEVPLGQGKVNYPALIERLKQLNYSGHLTIEREVSGPRQRGDIIQAIGILQQLLA